MCSHVSLHGANKTRTYIHVWQDKQAMIGLLEETESRVPAEGGTPDPGRAAAAFSYTAMLSVLPWGKTLEISKPKHNSHCDHGVYPQCSVSAGAPFTSRKLGRYERPTKRLHTK